MRTLAWASTPERELGDEGHGASGGVPMAVDKEDKQAAEGASLGMRSEESVVADQRLQEVLQELSIAEGDSSDSEVSESGTSESEDTLEEELSEPENGQQQESSDEESGSTSQESLE